MAKSHRKAQVTIDMSPYPWVNLDNDEEVLVDRHPSAWTLVDEILAGVGLVIISVVIVFRGPDMLTSFEIVGVPGEFALIFGALILSASAIGLATLKRIKTVYLITSKRVYRKEGILSYHGDPIDVNDIVDQEAEQGVLERQLGYGTVLIKTPATADLDDSNNNMGHLVFQEIPDPIDVKEELRQAKKMRRKHKKEEEMQHERDIRQRQNTLR